MGAKNAVTTTDGRGQKLETLKSFGYNEEQLRVIANTVAKGANYSELFMFLSVASARNLDPFTRQIHFIKRGGKATIQIGIDGFRSIADRTGQYAGSDEPVFEWDENSPYPVKATVTVWKLVGGHRVPFTRSVWWEEYYPGDGKEGFMWRKMPRTMLAKCAEAVTLRVAFPSQLSGVYVPEEMDQSGAAARITPDRPDSISIDTNEVASPDSFVPNDCDEVEVEEADVVGEDDDDDDETMEGGEDEEMTTDDPPLDNSSVELNRLLASMVSSNDLRVWASVNRDRIESLDEKDRAALREKFAMLEESRRAETNEGG